MSRDRHSRPPYDSKLPPVHNPSTIPDSTSRFPVSPPVAGSYPPPYDSQRQRRDTADSGPRRESYEQGPRDTASNSQRPSYSNRVSSNQIGAQRPPLDTARRSPENRSVTFSRLPPSQASASHQRQPSDPQWSPDNIVQLGNQLGVQRPPRDRASADHQRQPSDAQWSSGNPISSNQRQALGTQRPLRDTVSTGLQRQPSDAQWPLESSVGSHQRQPVGTQRSLRDTGSTSHQRQPSDAQWSTDTSASSNHRPSHGTQRPQRDTASTSYQRQFSDSQRSDPLDGGGGSNYHEPGGAHGGTHGRTRGGARGVDLTGQVRILPFPGKKYQWLIGAGAFTDVFKGEYRQVMAPGTAEARPVFVAVKIFRSACDDQQQREDVSRRLIRESSVWLRLDHPNIQPYLGHCSDLGLSVALISPLCGNSTVLKYITINPSANKLQLVKDVVKGLDYLHSNDVIHGDLQCNNVLVDEGGRARLTDFGRAKVIGEVGYSTQMLAGSAAYMAPELFPLTDVDVDNLFSEKSDVYAFGMLCFEIFTNQEPFASYNARQDWQVVPLIHQGKRPICSSHVQRQITKNHWAIMEACWTTVPANRLSAAQIMQRMV